jgi:hypothetical protein
VNLQESAHLGCGGCHTLWHVIYVFVGLAPDFESNYGFEYMPESIFPQQNDCGSLCITLQVYGFVRVDIIEIYTKIGKHGANLKTEKIASNLLGYLKIWPSIGYAKDVPEHMTLAKATWQIKSWLSQCDTNHLSCKNSSKIHVQLPTRVLHLGMHKVSLLETAGKKGRYIALSHCWGSSQVLTTTETTFNERLSCIRWKQLPRLFQDAISLTRSLGLKYL